MKIKNFTLSSRNTIANKIGFPIFFYKSETKRFTHDNSIMWKTNEWIYYANPKCRVYFKERLHPYNKTVDYEFFVDKETDYSSKYLPVSTYIDDKTYEIIGYHQFDTSLFEMYERLRKCIAAINFENAIFKFKNGHWFEDKEAACFQDKNYIKLIGHEKFKFSEDSDQEHNIEWFEKFASKELVIDWSAEKFEQGINMVLENIFMEKYLIFPQLPKAKKNR